jgi:hypothetical protein
VGFEIQDLANLRRGTLTDHSGTITAGGTSQQVCAANPNRRYLILQNLASEDLYFNFSNAAVIGQPSFRLGAKGTADDSFVMEAGYVSTEAVYIIGATTGDAFVAKEG